MLAAPPCLAARRQRRQWRQLSPCRGPPGLPPPPFCFRAEPSCWPPCASWPFPTWPDTSPSPSFFFCADSLPGYRVRGSGRFPCLVPPVGSADAAGGRTPRRATRPPRRLPLLPNLALLPKARLSHFIYPPRRSPCPISLSSPKTHPQPPFPHTICHPYHPNPPTCRTYAFHTTPHIHAHFPLSPHDHPP